MKRRRLNFKAPHDLSIVTTNEWALLPAEIAAQIADRLEQLGVARVRYLSGGELRLLRDERGERGRCGGQLHLLVGHEALVVDGLAVGQVELADAEQQD